MRLVTIWLTRQRGSVGLSRSEFGSKSGFRFWSMLHPFPVGLKLRPPRFLRPVLSTSLCHRARSRSPSPSLAFSLALFLSPASPSEWQSSTRCRRKRRGEGGGGSGGGELQKDSGEVEFRSNQAKQRERRAALAASQGTSPPEKPRLKVRLAVGRASAPAQQPSHGEPVSPLQLSSLQKAAAALLRVLRHGFRCGGCNACATGAESARGEVGGREAEGGREREGVGACAERTWKFL